MRIESATPSPCLERPLHTGNVDPAVTAWMAAHVPGDHVLGQALNALHLAASAPPPPADARAFQLAFARALVDRLIVDDAQAIGASPPIR